jgi:hypothetical protein
MRHVSLSLLVLFVIFLLGSAVVACGQESDTPAVAQVVEKAAAQRNQYLSMFRDLISVENKSFEIYEKDGKIHDRRHIKSIFIVYQLPQEDKSREEYRSTAEFRNVLEVDGKSVDNMERRAIEFFLEIERSESTAWQMLRVESQRFDLGLRLNGLTLFQSVALEDRLRPYFEFSITGRELIDGNDTYVVSYQQVKPCPYIYVNTRSDRGTVPASIFYKTNLQDNVDYKEKLSGNLVIDAQTFQIWREKRLVTVQPSGFNSPATLMENEFVYGKSEFGILTPTTITHTQYLLSRKERTMIKHGKVTFEYDRFTRPDVDVKSSIGSKP